MLLSKIASLDVVADCSLKAQFIPVGVASESFSKNFGFSRFEINRLHSKDWNNTAIQMTTNEGLARCPFVRNM